MKQEVFISYAHEDRAIADSVCTQLEQRQIGCWIAPRDILPGANYAQAIISAIDESRLMVLIFSSHANDSPHVMREVERAVHDEIPVIPFRIEAIRPSGALEYYIGPQHWLDAMTPPVERHFEKLSEAVEQLLKQLREENFEGTADAGDHVVEKGVAAKKRGIRQLSKLSKPFAGKRKWVTYSAVAAVIVLLVGASYASYAGIGHQTQSGGVDALLSSFVDEYYNATKNQSAAVRMDVSAWSVFWINETSVRINFKLINQTDVKDFYFFEINMRRFQSVSDASSFMQTHTAGYKLDNTTANTFGTYQRVTGHAPSVYRNFARFDDTTKQWQSIMQVDFFVIWGSQSGLYNV